LGLDFGNRITSVNLLRPAYGDYNSECYEDAETKDYDEDYFPDEQKVVDLY